MSAVVFVASSANVLFPHSQVIAASQAPIEWDIVDNIKDRITPEAIASLKSTGVGIKGQFITGIGRNSLPSINVQLREVLNLYANIVSAVTIPGEGRHYCVCATLSFHSCALVPQACPAATRMLTLS